MLSKELGARTLSWEFFPFSFKEYLLANKLQTKIDFVTGTEGNIEPYQVCADLSDEDTKKRELRAISEACTELKCKQATVVTLYDEGTFSLKDCTVKILRAVDWLLS